MFQHQEEEICSSLQDMQTGSGPWKKHCRTKNRDLTDVVSRDRDHKDKTGPPHATDRS